MDSSEHDVQASPPDATETRRALLQTSLGGFALATCGLFLPPRLEEVAARDGAKNGELGGRHGKNHRRRDKHKRRDHHKKKDHGNERPPQGAIFRDVALFVHNMRNVPIQVQGWQLRSDGSGGNLYVMPDSSWDWSTIEAKPATGMENFKDFWGRNWEVAVRINTDRVVHACNHLFHDPTGRILSGGWDGKYGWNPKGGSPGRENVHGRQ